MLNYELVSMAVILRDITNPQYVNIEHEKLVDIADALYNADITPEYLKEDYKQLYEKYGAKYWANVIKDASAIDTQLQGHEGELIEEYSNLIKEFNHEY